MQAVADVPETPLYLHEKGLLLTDINRQLGPADFLVTVAPGAFDTTWPVHLHDSWLKSCKPMLATGILESCHLLHVLQEIIRGYLVGGKQELRGCCTASPFQNGSACKVLCWAARVEFQDGTRRRTDQTYHGTGLPHVHAIFWLSAAERSKVAAAISADIGATEPARAAVLRQQRSSDSSGKLSTAESHWVWTGAEWNLVPKRGLEACHAGIRTYLVPLLLARLGHQDISMVRNSAGVCQYMSKLCAYVTKVSDTLDPEWLSFTKSGHEAVRGPSNVSYATSSVSHGCKDTVACSLSSWQGHCATSTAAAWCGTNVPDPASRWVLPVWMPHKAG